MAPWLAIIARNIPWTELVRRAPDIIDGSKRLLDKGRPPANPLPGQTGSAVDLDIDRRLAALESRENAQAEVTAQIVAQLEDLTTGLAVLAARNRLLLYMAAALWVVVIALGVTLVIT
jgi:hypothetical protein